MSSELSNNLAFLNKNKFIAVAYKKQDKANNLISQINQQKTTRDFNDLKMKMNSSVIVNDILNTIFPSVINTNFPIKPIGRPKLSDEEKARREQLKLSKQIEQVSSFVSPLFNHYLSLI